MNKSIILVLGIMAVLAISGCVTKPKKVGDSCFFGYECSNIDCNKPDSPVCEKGKCTCPWREVPLSKPINVFCLDPDVAAVYSCSDGSVRVVSKLEGAGFKVIKPDGTEFNCPLIAQPSNECLEALENCSEVNLCS